jgi:plasmid stabilization system protein ParE
LKRFFISPAANQDLDEFRQYIDSLPSQPGDRMAHALGAVLLSIAANPYLGQASSALTRIAGEEIRSRLLGKYRVIYRFSRSAPEIIGILHTARDIPAILAQRLQ